MMLNFMDLLYTCTKMRLFFSAGASSPNFIFSDDGTCRICPMFSLSACVVADKKSFGSSLDVNAPNVHQFKEHRDSPSV